MYNSSLAKLAILNRTENFVVIRYIAIPLASIYHHRQRQTVVAIVLHGAKTVPFKREQFLVIFIL